MHSQLVYRETLNRIITPSTRWLDIGCGHTVFPNWIRDSVPFQKSLISRCSYAVGVDPIDTRPHVGGMQKLTYDYATLPFENNNFSLVTANMVAEHVENPDCFLQEISRILRPEGLLVIHTPNLFYPPILVARCLPSSFIKKIAHGLDGRDYDDIFPTYYRLNTGRAFRKIRDFEVVKLDCVETYPIFQRIPVLRHIEKIMHCVSGAPFLENSRADWLAVLRKN